MAKIKCIGFDLYSTLINADNPNWDEMLQAVFHYIQNNLAYKGTYKDFLKIRDPIYNKWQKHRTETNREYPSEIWWNEILQSLKLRYTQEDINNVILKGHQIWRTQISLYPDARELLDQLKNDYLIVCVSNISEGNLARGDMDLFGILKVFDYVLMSSDIGIRKPSPEIFCHVLNHFDIQAQEMIFVGDTLYDDIQGAKEANLLMAIHVKRNRDYFYPDYYIKPDKTIYNLLDLFEILKSL